MSFSNSFSSTMGQQLATSLVDQMRVEQASDAASRIFIAEQRLGELRRNNSTVRYCLLAGVLGLVVGAAWMLSRKKNTRQAPASISNRGQGESRPL